MKHTKSIYPALMSDRVAETADFYCKNFGFAPTFQESWYVSLRHTEVPELELAILQFDHASVPADYRARSQGILINVEVENATATHERLIQREGLREVQPLRDEAWGQRHFITQDPAGNLVDVIESIEVSAAFQDAYADG